MYARQKTREPGSAFFGEFGTIPGDPERQPAAAHGQLLRPQQRLRRRTTRPRSRSAMATTSFDDSGTNYPAFDAATLGLPASYVNQLTYNTFPASWSWVPATARHDDTVGNIRAEQHHALHALGQRDGVEAGRPSHPEGRRRIPPHRAPTPSSTARRPARSTSRRRYTQASPTTASTTAGDAFASFLLGYPASGSVVSATPAHLPDRLRRRLRAGRIPRHVGADGQLRPAIRARAGRARARQPHHRRVRSRCGVPGAGARARI